MTSKKNKSISPLVENQNTTLTKKSKTRKQKKDDDEVNRALQESKKFKLEQEQEEEKRLTSLLFGPSGASAWKDDDDDDDEYENDQQDRDSGMMDSLNDTGAMFEIDRVGAGIYHDDHDDIHENAEEDDDDESNQGDNEGGNAVWVDEDDEDLTYSLVASDRTKKLRESMRETVVTGEDYEARLRERHAATRTTRTDWADLDNHEGLQGSDDEVGEEEEIGVKLLSSTKSLLASSSTRLQPHILNVVRCPDANSGHYNSSTVNVVQFHPGSDEDEPLMMTGGLDKTLRFFKVNSEGSQKVHGIHFPNMPIHCASFLGNTGNIAVSGRRKFFYLYDAESGKMDKIPYIQGRKEKSLEKFVASPDGSLIAFIGNDGYIILVEAKSKSWVADLKMNGSARAVSFSPCGDFITASGSDGEVYRWDIRSKKCIDRFQNEDGTITSFISASSRFLAVGAESGVVNIYNDNCSPFQKRSPLKSIMNMHTSIDFMRFNPTGEILALSSRREKDSLKLVHMPTQTVFSNWPTSKTPLGYVWSIDFSPGSKFMAVGNDKGKCLLYKLLHYNE